MSKLTLLASVGTVACAAASVSHRVLHLSSPRRDIAVAATSHAVVIAGGCADSNTTSPYVCNYPTSDIDVFSPKTHHVLSLSSARAWSSACAVGDAVVIAGGGTTAAKSAAADIVDTVHLTVASNESALSEARWGIACASTRNAVVFAGGLSTEYTDAVDVYSARDNSWSASEFHISSKRESMGALSSVDATSVSFLGGWNEHGEPPNFATVDSFNLTSGQSHVSALNAVSYWTGGVSVRTQSYAVDNGVLNFRSSNDIEANWSSTPLPDYLQGEPFVPSEPWESTGPIPSSHVPQNGVSVGDGLACFYGLSTSGWSALHCFDTSQNEWLEPFNCSAAHKAGGIAALGNTVYIAGGYDPSNNNSITDVVDVFSDFPTRRPITDTTV